jgi:hypothetical protein
MKMVVDFTKTLIMTYKTTRDTITSVTTSYLSSRIASSQRISLQYDVSNPINRMTLIGKFSAHTLLLV